MEVDEDFDFSWQHGETNLTIKFMVIDSNFKSNTACDRIKNDCSKFPILGIYTKCLPEPPMLNSPYPTMNILQVATPQNGQVFVFRLDLLKKVPAFVEIILKDKNVIKLSIAPDKDSLFFNHFFGLIIECTIDLRTVLNTSEELSSLAEENLGFSLPKNNLFMDIADIFSSVNEKLCYFSKEAFTTMEIFKKWSQIIFNSAGYPHIGFDWFELESRIKRLINVSYKGEKNRNQIPVIESYSDQTTQAKGRNNMMKNGEHQQLLRIPWSSITKSSTMNVTLNSKQDKVSQIMKFPTEGKVTVGMKNWGKTTLFVRAPKNQYTPKDNGPVLHTLRAPTEDKFVCLAKQNVQRTKIPVFTSSCIAKVSKRSERYTNKLKPQVVHVPETGIDKSFPKNLDPQQLLLSGILKKKGSQVPLTEERNWHLVKVLQPTEETRNGQETQTFAPSLTSKSGNSSYAQMKCDLPSANKQEFQKRESQSIKDFPPLPKLKKEVQNCAEIPPKSNLPIIQNREIQEVPQTTTGTHQKGQNLLLPAKPKQIILPNITKCAICGAKRRTFVRHHVVPKFCLTYFPAGYNPFGNNVENILKICSACKRKCLDGYVVKLMNTLYYVAGVHLNKRDLNCVEKERKRAICCKIDECKSAIMEFHKISYDWKPLKPIGYCEGGAAIVEMFERNNVPLSELCRLCRRFFLEVMQPKFLPENFPLN